MKKEKVAENIVDDLNNLETRSRVVDKTSRSYKDLQIEIVLKHLRRLKIEPRKMVDDMIDEFEEQLKDDPGNFLAAFGIDVCKEIRKIYGKV